MLLRLLGPIVVVLTVSVFATGIVLLLGPPGWRSQLLLLHKASFILWLAVMAFHVLGHLVDTARLAPRDWYRRTRRQVRGAGLRQWAVATSLALGLVLGLLAVPRVAPWLAAGHLGHG
jgi:cytochrome c biogenesis protein CcdA